MGKASAAVFEEIRREDGGCETASFGTATPDLHRMVRRLQERGAESAAMESTSVCWIPAADLLETGGIEAALADAREARMVPGRKSDVRDCQRLQRLHGCGLLRGAFRPPEAAAAARSILREKDSVAAMRTQAIQQMQKSLDQMNIRVHHAASDIDGKTGMAIIKATVAGERNPAALRDRRCKKGEKETAGFLTGAWRDERLFNLGQAFKTLQFLDERVAEYDAKAPAAFESLAAAAPGNPPPPPASPGKKTAAKGRSDAGGKAALRRLMGFGMASIPGDGGGHSIGGRGIVWPFPGRAPLRVAHRPGSLARQERRADKKTAVKATARRMAHTIYRGVKYGVEYIDCGTEAYEARLRERTVNTVNRLIKSFNIICSEVAAALAVT
jgi:hypothetical protein